MTNPRFGHLAFVFSSVMLLCLLPACSEVEEPGAQEPEDASFLGGGGRADGYGVSVSRDEARGVLLLVNTASFELLHFGVPIYERPARNIVEHRAGADGVLGTEDDRLFETLEELDAVPYVGPVTFNRLLEYARDHHYVLGHPQPAVHGIAERSPEALRILDVVNGYDFEALDEAIGLDRRAVDGIVSERPFDSLLDLDRVPYVAAVAFAKLSSHVRAQYLFEVVGYVWRDASGDGGFVPAAGLEGFVVFSDENGEGELTEGLPFTVTGAGGGYSLWLDRASPEVRITQALPLGWSNTFAGQVGEFGESLTWATGPKNDVPRIVGGEDADIDDFPFMVALLETWWPDTPSCGGALIAGDYVLTAAHCVEWDEPSDILVRYGTDEIHDDRGGGMEVAEIVIHPEYSRVTSGYDIALLKLQEPVLMPRIPVLTEENAWLAAPGTVATTMGWGALSHGWGAERPERLQKVEVPIVSEAQCRAALEHKDIENIETQICAGFDEGERDSCQGDSGGPLVVPDMTGDGWLHAGVVSWGDGCAEPGLPGVYARTSHFTDWLLSHMAPEPSLVVELDAGTGRVEASFANFR